MRCGSGSSIGTRRAGGVPTSSTTRHLNIKPTQQRALSILGVAAKRHLNIKPTQRRSLSVFGVAVERHLNIKPTQRWSLSVFGVAAERHLNIKPTQRRVPEMFGIFANFTEFLVTFLRPQMRTRCASGSLELFARLAQNRSVVLMSCNHRKSITVFIPFTSSTISRCG